MQKTSGQIGYEAYYNAVNPGKTFDGRDMPPWESLKGSDAGRQTMDRWEIAAIAIQSFGVPTDPPPPPPSVAV